MNIRASLVGTLLVAPAWAEDPPSFDLHSAAIRKIVNETAATQFGQPPLPEEPAKKPETQKTVKFVPPQKLEHEKAPVLRPAPAKLPRNDVVVTLVDIVADTLSDIADVDLSREQFDDWLRCPARAEDMPGSRLLDYCPGRQSSWGLTEPLGYQNPEVRAR